MPRSRVIELEAATHECPIAGCSRRAAGETLMCPYHWRMVPRQLAREVYYTWNDGSPLPEYLDVRAAAIGAVHSALEGSRR